MDTRVAFMTQYSSLLRGLAAGSAFLFLFAPTAFAAEQTVEPAENIRDAKVKPSRLFFIFYTP